MKTKERMDVFERMIMELASRLECQRRRIDDLAARVAELEIVADRDTRYMAYVARKAAKAHRRIDALERARSLSVSRDIIERAERERREAVEREAHHGTWWYDDGERAAYTVTVEER